MSPPDEALHDAAETIRAADALLIGAGAGMGITRCYSFNSCLRFPVKRWSLV